MGAEDEGEGNLGLQLLNGVQNMVGDYVRAKLGQDTFEKTISEVKKVLPSLQHLKVVSYKFLDLFNP